MILNKGKKVLQSSYFKFVFMSLIIFFVMDVIASNTIVKNIIKKDCLKYFKYSVNNKNFYSYELEKNCIAYETKRTVKTYNVITDKYGYRIGKKKDNYSKKDKIVFLGDSFTYGFGVNYEDSIIGFLKGKKTNYEFVNLAVPGYSPSILKVKLEQLIKRGIKPKAPLFRRTFNICFC